LLLLTFSLIEVGFIYTTGLAYVLMAIAFSEMISVQVRQAKEAKI